MLIPQADRYLVLLCFLQRDAAFQHRTTYNLVVSKEVLKHVYVAERPQSRTLKNRILWT